MAHVPVPEPAAWSVLVRLCVEPEAHAAAEVGRLLDEGLDIASLVLAARRHRLHLLLGRICLVAPLHGRRHDVLQLARDNYLLHRHRAALFRREACVLAQRLAGSVESFAVTKGVALQEVLYHGDGSRWFGDLDVMVARAEADRVGDTLTTLGYRVGEYDERLGTVRPLTRDEELAYALSPDHLPRRARTLDDVAVPGMNVDVALSLTWARSAWQVPLADALAVTQPVDTRDGRFPTLVPPYQLLFVVLHLFREAWFELTMARIRLSQFRDVWHGWTALSAGERAELARIVARHGVEPPVGWVLGHADRLFGSASVSELGLDEPDDDWLHSYTGRGDRLGRWSGDMSDRLRTGIVAVDPPG
jgi:hypothetical protein